MDVEGEAISCAQRVLKEVTGKDPVHSWEGISVPIVASLLDGIVDEAVLVGFGLEDDNTHGANESFSLDQFRRGFEYSGLMLSALQDCK